MKDEKWDFYYSLSQDKVIQSHEPRKRNYVYIGGNKEQYTHATDIGEEPRGNFTDYIYIGYANIDDTTIEYF